MRCSRPLLAGLVMLVLAWPFSAWGGSFTDVVTGLPGSSDDSELREDSPNEWNGDKDSIWLKDDAGGKERHLIHRLDLTPYVGFTILQAQLSLYQYDANNSIPMDVRVHPVAEDWAHLWVTWDERDNGTPWATPGGTHLPLWTDRALVSDADTDSRHVWEVGPILAAEQWGTLGLPVHGILMTAQGTAPEREARFRSNNEPVVSERPEWTVVYTDEPPAVSSAVAEVQPEAVVSNAVDTWLSIYVDIDLSLATPTGLPTGVDVIRVRHEGNLNVKELEWVEAAGTPIDTALVSWSDDGTDLLVQLPSPVTVSGVIRFDIRTDILEPVNNDGIALPVMVRNSATGADFQAAWSGNADGVAGNGDDWVVRVGTLIPVGFDLRPDADSLSVGDRAIFRSVAQAFLSGSWYPVYPDSMQVVPSHLGTVSPTGEFSALAGGTAGVVAFYGSWRDTSWVTITGGFDPVISGLEIRDVDGLVTNDLVPRDTFFVKVTLEDGDGFHDVSDMGFSLYYDGHEDEEGAPAYSAIFRWQRDGLPSWTIEQPTLSTWRVLPGLCIADTVSDVTGPVEIRLAFVPGIIARQSNSWHWNLKVTATSDARTITSYLTNWWNMESFVFLATADLAGVFAPGHPGDENLPLVVPADGKLGLAVGGNCTYHFEAFGDDLVGVTDTTQVIPITVPAGTVRWDLVPGTSGVLGPDAANLESNVAPNEAEYPQTRVLRLHAKLPPGAMPQSYLGRLNLRLSPKAGGSPADLPIPLTMVVLGDSLAADSVLAEVLPDTVTAGTAAQAFSAHLRAHFELGDTGFDLIAVNLPAGYGSPTITAVTVDGGLVPFTDQSVTGRAEALLAAPVTVDANVVVSFSADVPAAANPTGENFRVDYDDTATSSPAQTATEGDGDGSANSDDWRVVVIAGPPAIIDVTPDTETVFVDSTAAFSAAVTDAHGNPLSPAVSWNTEGGVGLVDGAGVFTATAPGAGIVIGEAGGVRDTSAVTVLPNPGLALRSVTGPAAVAQGDLGVAFQVRLENLGSRTVGVDDLLLDFTRTLTGDADGDFAVTPDAGNPATLPATSEGVFLFTADVDRDAVPSSIKVDASVTGTEAGTGVTLSDNGADTTLTLTLDPAGITVRAEQLPATLDPGAQDALLLTLDIANAAVNGVALQAITLSNTTTGPGSQAARDAELGMVTLYQDNGNRIFEPAMDTPLATAAASGGSLSFGSFAASVAGQDSARLFLGADLPLAVRDGDALDLLVEAETALTFDASVFTRNAWPLNPPEAFPLDGMIASQIGVASVPGTQTSASETDVLGLDVTVPRNGYEDDVLNEVRLVNLGTALPTADLSAVKVWRDGGNGTFDAGGGDDALLGPAAWDGSAWTLTGLNQAVPAAGTRLFGSFDVVAMPTVGRTVRLSLPTGPSPGLVMASDNDGPRDVTVANPGTQIIVADPSAVIRATANPQLPATLHPGGAAIEIFRVTVENATQETETLTEMSLENMTAGPGTMVQLDGDWSTLTLSSESLVPAGPLLAGTPTATVVSDQAVFTGLGLVLDPGDRVDLVVTGGASLAARDGDLLDLRMAGPEGLQFSRTVPFEADWPLHPAGSFTVDGMVVAQIGFDDQTGGAVEAGATNQLALSAHVPANGYSPDLLQQVLVGDLGDAVPGQDLDAVRVWRDGGDQTFNAGAGDDVFLGAATWNGSHWVLGGLSQSVPVTGLQLFVSVDVASTATPGRTIRLWLPPTPDDAFRMASANSGPIDAGLANSGSLVITADPDAAVEITAFDQATSELLPGGDPVETLVLTVTNGTAFPETLAAVTLSNLTAGPGSPQQRDAEWSSLSLALDTSAGVTNLAGLFPTTGFASGAAIFTGLSIEVQPGATAVLHVTGGASLAARDGDILDLGVAGPGSLIFNRPVAVNGTWPLNPSGGFPVNGMAAAQIEVAAVVDTDLMAGAAGVLALDLLVPANGYEADLLESLRLENDGTAVAGEDIAAVRIWRDGGNGIFDAGAGDDADLGSAPWNGDAWLLSGLSEPVPVDGLRIFAALDLESGAEPGRTVRLALPSSPDFGLLMAGPNDGPRDLRVTAPDLLTFGADPNAALYVSAVPQSGGPLLPGGDAVEMFRLLVENRTAHAETLLTLALTTETTGPGSDDDLSAAWSTIDLVPLGPGDKPRAPSALPIGTGAHGNASAAFTGLTVPVPAGETLALSIIGGAALTARDGDALDLRLEDAGDLVFSGDAPLVGTWPLDPAGSFLVDGMAAAQIELSATPDGVAEVGEDHRLVLSFVVPANGYEEDVLQAVRLDQLGTAEATRDVARVTFWADGGDGIFDAGAGDDETLGNAVWDGMFWLLSGMDITVPLGGRRIYVGVDIGDEAEPGRTVRFAIPASPVVGLSMASGNDGPRDRPVANPGTLTIIEDLSGELELTAEAPIGLTLLPGGPHAEILRLQMRNTSAVPETLTALTLRNTSRGPGTQTELDAEWTAAYLVPAPVPGTAPADPEIEALASAVFSEGRSHFSGFFFTVSPGESRELAVYAGATLAARDSDDLDMALTGPEAVTFRPPVSVSGSWPLNPVGSFRVDGMAADQIEIAPVPPGNVESGSTGNPALNMVLPRNGYTDDILQRLNVVNLGTAQAGIDIDAVTLWIDDGDGLFDSAADRLIGPLTFTGNRWEITGLSEPVGPDGTRVHLSVDVSDLAVEGRSVELAIPSLPDLGVGMASGNDGPLDRMVANGSEQIITVADRLILSASPIASGVVQPGDDDVALLDLVITNTYDEPRTLSGITFANASTGNGDEADLDGAFDVLLLAADRNGDEIYDAGDEVVGSAAFAMGEVSFRGLGLVLEPDVSGRLFLLGDVSLRGAADGDLLAARLNGPLDLAFAEPTAVAASWPLDSGARWVVDGMVADQITRFDTGPATVGPGAGPLPALDLLVPGNGYLADELNGLRIINQGSADEGDLSDVHLWRDGGDAVFSPSGGDDLDLGPLSWIGDSWQSLFLEDPLSRDGARYFITVTVAGDLSDSSTVRLAVPVNGITMNSGNDGPIDRPIGSEQTVLLSSAPLLAGLAISPSASTVGQTVTVTMSVTNVGDDAIHGVTPSGLTASGAGALTSTSGPTPLTLNLAPGESGAFDWTFTAAAAGPVELSGLASGAVSTPGDRRSLTTTSNRHQVFVEADELELFALESMPFSVSLGQRAVVPLSLTFRNPGSETGSDILLTALRIRLEDEDGNGIVPAELLTRVVVNEGNRVYLDRPAAQLETGGSDADLVLATPVRITNVEPSTLNLQFDIADEAVASNFRIVVADSTWVKAADATSGAPVAIALQERPYPIQSGLARIVAEAVQVSVTGEEAGEQRVGPGARDVDLLSMTLENPGLDNISADIRMGAFAVRLTDAAGSPIVLPRERLGALRVKTAFQTLAVREVTPLDGETMAFQLSPPLTLPVNTPVAVTVSGDLVAGAAVGTLRLELAGSESFDCRDAISWNLVPAVYDVNPIQGHVIHIESPADSVRVEGTPLFPAGLLVGAAGVDAVSAVIRHPGPAGTARIRLDALTVECRNEAHAVLSPSQYLDRVSVLWRGEEVGAVNELPTSDSPFDLPLSGVVLEPGGTGDLQLRVDVESSAPAAFLELTIPATGIAAVDLNSGRPVVAAPSPGAELPLYSGLTRLESPARDVTAGLDDLMPAVLVPATAGIETGLLHLMNPAPAGSGLIQIDHLVVRASDDDGGPVNVGGVLDRVSIRLGEETIAASAGLAPDSVTATIRLAEPLSLRAGDKTALAVMADLCAEPVATGFRLGFDQTDIGVVQPAGALFEVEVRPREGETFPLWTTSGSFTPAGLRDSYANFPNPFAAGREPTTFVFNLPVDAVVTLRIWTPRGDEVATLLEDEPRAAGLWQQDRWHGQNGQGATVVNGVYIAELTVRFTDGSTERLLRKVAVAR